MTTASYWEKKYLNLVALRAGAGSKAEAIFGAPIVAMIEYRGAMFVATSEGLYRKELGEDKFKPVLFEVAEDDEGRYQG
jgi:hypothetical protein